MNLFLSLVRRGSSSSAQRPSSSNASARRMDRRARQQMSRLMDSVGRMEDRA
jgi:hypothetical protein